MNRKILVALYIAATCLFAQYLAGCATVAVAHEVQVPLSQLQTTLTKKFPIKHRYLALVDVTVTNPRISLASESNRILTTVDAEIAPILFVGTLKGSFTLSGVPAIDGERHALVLRDARMEKLTFTGADTELATQLAKVSDLLALNTLGDIPLYTFDAEQFRYGGKQFFPTKITTAPEGIVVTFEPVK
jgi:hypothetical protein